MVHETYGGDLLGSVASSFAPNRQPSNITEIVLRGGMLEYYCEIRSIASCLGSVLKHLCLFCVGLRQVHFHRDGIGGLKSSTCVPPNFVEALSFHD